MSDPALPTSRPRRRREDAVAVVKRLRDAGHVAYFAGGCVRDLLLGLEPKDFDVATDAPPDRVREIFPKTQSVGAAFGVILVRQGGSIVEVATFRKDLEYEDGRHPVGVRFTTAEEDAQRRDFTINGIFLDPINDRVIDYVGGQADLKAKVIRAIGDPLKRFDEDHLRMLRAIRFAARFGFNVDAQTDDAIRRDAPKLARISPERIAEELRLMLSPPTRVAAWKKLADSGLIDVIFRFAKGECARLAGLFSAVQPGQPIAFGLALAGAALELGRASFDPESARAVVLALRKSLKLSNDEADDLHGSLTGLSPLLQDGEPTTATLKRFLAGPTSPLSRALLAALPESPRRRWLTARLAELEKTDFAPPPLLTGDDLVAAGWQPGKLFKQVLNDVYDAQLENRITTKEDALKLATALAQR